MIEFPRPITDLCIRFALVTYAGMRKNHLDALIEYVQRAELVGVCDIDTKALVYARNTGVRAQAQPFRSLRSPRRTCLSE